MENKLFSSICPIATILIGVAQMNRNNAIEIQEQLEQQEAYFVPDAYPDPVDANYNGLFGMDCLNVLNGVGMNDNGSFVAFDNCVWNGDEYVITQCNSTKNGIVVSSYSDLECTTLIETNEYNPAQIYSEMNINTVYCDVTQDTSKTCEERLNDLFGDFHFDDHCDHCNGSYGSNSSNGTVTFHSGTSSYCPHGYVLTNDGNLFINGLCMKESPTDDFYTKFDCNEDKDGIMVNAYESSDCNENSKRYSGPISESTLLHDGIEDVYCSPAVDNKKSLCQYVHASIWSISDNDEVTSSICNSKPENVNATDLIIPIGICVPISTSDVSHELLPEHDVLLSNLTNNKISELYVKFETSDCTEINAQIYGTNDCFGPVFFPQLVAVDGKPFIEMSFDEIEHNVCFKSIECKADINSDSQSKANNNNIYIKYLSLICLFITSIIIV